MATATSGLQNYEESFSGFAKSAAGRELSWLRDLRQSGFTRFTATGFPTTRDEDWRFTNPAVIAQTHFRLVRNGHSLPSKDELAPFRVPGAGCQAVFIDGRFAPQLSTIGKLPSGVIVASLAAELARIRARLNLTWAATSIFSVTLSVRSILRFWRMARSFTSPRARWWKNRSRCSSFQPRTMRRL